MNKHFDMEHYLTLATLVVCLMIWPAAADLLTQAADPNTLSIEACADGTYKSSTHCQQCTKCTDFESVVFKCNSTNDSVCECIPDYYRDSIDGLCKPCTKCSVGWGASPACTSTTNTVCAPCPKGSYSSVESSTKICQSCTLCDTREEIQLKTCTSKQDTTCFKVKRKTPVIDEPPTTMPCVNGDCLTPKDNSYLYTAPMYCAGLGAVILGLLIYVMFRCKADKKRLQMTSSNLKQPASAGYHIVQQLPPYSSMQCQSTASPVVYLQNSGTTITVTMATNYADLPSNVRRTISRSLSVDGSWLNLAHYLGFTPSQISQIQQKAEESNRRSSVGSILMSEWTKRDFSSVGVIIHALASINRLDLVALIQNSNSMKGSEIV